jgi:hypothetical protein
MGGVASALVPQGAVGCLSGLFLLIVLAVVAGLVEGIWLAAAGVGLVLLVFLIRRALKAEMRREDRRPARPPGTTTLPEDSELTDEERREAMRRFTDGRSDGP